MKNFNKWLNNHPSLNHSSLEREANIPIRTIAHFLSKANHRDIRKKHWDKLKIILMKYGWKKETT